MALNDTEQMMLEDQLRHLRLDYEVVKAERDALRKVLELVQESLGVTTPEGLRCALAVVEAARFVGRVFDPSDEADNEDRAIKDFRDALAALDAAKEQP